MGTYVPSTLAERQEMLNSINCKSMDELFAKIPKEMLIEKLNIPNGLSELEVAKKMEEIADKNVVFKSIFRGAGAYNHFIPSIVKSVVNKEEFLTAYTPYQAEISQGILQSIFEYQTMICELTGMHTSNASVYDGATAAAEAVAMCRERSRTTAIVSATTNPEVIETIKTYCFGAGTEVIIAPSKDGVTDMEALATLIDAKTACVYIQQPNYLGQIEEATKIAEIAHNGKAKFIMGCNPISLAIMKTPAECGADIAVGEGQPLGMPLSFGGPYLGFMSCTEKMTRKLPGRVVGETTDVDGKRAFVLTLQAREQHIRREKASSNICSNQALCALTASVYMSAMGPQGIKDAATQSMSKAKYLADGISSIKGFEVKFTNNFFNEFVTTCPICVEKLMTELEKNNILGGYPLKGENEGCILWCATEMNTKEEIDKLVNIIKEVSI